jgi:hypothetical protein
MPSIVTHHIFAKDISKKVNFNENDIYLLFAQSHDYLLYNFNKHIRFLGHTGHIFKTQDYLLNIIDYIKTNHLEENKELLSYLYGSITHYILDSTIHPYIFYKTGIYSRKNKALRKYKGMHRVMERNIDGILYQRRYKRKYCTLNISKDIIKKPIFSEELKKCIDYAYEKTYKVKNLANIYIKSIKEAKILFRTTNYDRLGIKKVIYALNDKLFGFNITCISNHIKLNHMYMNNEKKEWYHPCTKEENDQSFDELYQMSAIKCTDTIKIVDLYLKDKVNIDKLKKAIPNISYTTGLDLSLRKKMSYFE